MFRTSANLNPAVRREAELFTDGKLTDAVLAGVAARLGLPLLAPVMDAPAPRPDAIAAAQRELAEAEAVLRQAVHCFDVARAELGKANARTLPPIWKGKPPRPIPTATRLRLQSEAMAFLNTRRGMKRRAEKRLAAARAALLLVVS